MLDARGTLVGKSLGMVGAGAGGAADNIKSTWSVGLSDLRFPTSPLRKIHQKT